jgi:molecular chaperone DnaJ
MYAKDYYLILGVSSSATLEEIKSAFRRRAMELHPDRSGMESGPFLEIQEAYGVLGDPERRRRYDEQCRVTIVRPAPWRPTPEPFASRAVRSKPFAPAEPEYQVREISIGEPFGLYQPSVEELFERLWSNLEGVARPKSERLESLAVEVVLSRDKALRGGRVRARVSGLATCPVCGGSGASGRYECWRCEGEGTQSADYSLVVHYPPGIRNGRAVRISLNRFGVENFHLTVVFRVTEVEM